MSHSKNTINYHNWGAVPYKEAWDRQEEVFAQTVQQKILNRTLEEDQRITPSHHLILCTHPPVYTLGKSGSLDNLKLSEEELISKQIDFHKINRGGDITFHGPGQMVGYPILDLDQFFTDIHKYLRFLEEVIIRTIAEYGIKGDRLDGATGVWIEPENLEKARKICAMGIRCSRWVTMHGWALNVNTDMDYFNHIIPCGIDDKAVTSIQQEVGYKIDEEECRQKLLKHFSDVFEVEFKSERFR